MILDVQQDGMKIPKVEYEVYRIEDENKLIKLDLNLCKNNKIDISIPVSINGSIDIYNSSSGYYNDLCYTTTSDFGTDICLDDRRQNFIDNNLTLCEENCVLIDYDYTYKNAKCSCDIKIKLPLVEEIKFDKEKLKNNFIDINNIANLKCLKCYKIVFKKNNIKYNYGFYILCFIYLLYFVCLFLFYYKFYFWYFENVESVFFPPKNDINIEHMDTSSKKDNNLNQIKNSTKVIKIKKRTYIKKDGRIIKFKEVIKDKHSDNDITQIKGDISNNDNKNNSKGKIEILFNKEEKKENQKVKTKEEVLDYTDSELNSLSYEEALKIDKRTFIQYYI